VNEFEQHDFLFSFFAISPVSAVSAVRFFSGTGDKIAGLGANAHDLSFFYEKRNPHLQACFECCGFG
jgi:hypothetical protein